jgi:hypothetical protein
MTRFLLVISLMATILGGCSSSSGLSTPPLPSGWKTVTYHRIGIDVPASWMVEPWRANCGVAKPTVFIGPEGTSALNCPAFMASGAEVLLGARAFTGTGLHPTKQYINGLNAYLVSTDEVFHGHSGGTITYVWVTLIDKSFTIYVSVGDSSAFAGGAPGRAEEIVQTIHAVR